MRARRMTVFSSLLSALEAEEARRRQSREGDLGRGDGDAPPPSPLEPRDPRRCTFPYIPRTGHTRTNHETNPRTQTRRLMTSGAPHTVEQSPCS